MLNQMFVRSSNQNNQLQQKHALLNHKRYRTIEEEPPEIVVKKGSEKFKREDRPVFVKETTNSTCDMLSQRTKSTKHFERYIKMPHNNSSTIIHFNKDNVVNQNIEENQGKSHTMYKYLLGMKKSSQKFYKKYSCTDTNKIKIKDTSDQLWNFLKNIVSRFNFKEQTFILAIYLSRMIEVKMKQQPWFQKLKQNPYERQISSANHQKFQFSVCIYIASKFIESKVPLISEFQYFLNLNHIFDDKLFQDYERRILKLVDYELNIVTAMEFFKFYQEYPEFIKKSKLLTVEEREDILMKVKEKVWTNIRQGRFLFEENHLITFRVINEEIHAKQLTLITKKQKCLQKSESFSVLSYSNFLNYCSVRQIKLSEIQTNQEDQSIHKTLNTSRSGLHSQRSEMKFFTRKNNQSKSKSRAKQHHLQKQYEIDKNRKNQNQKFEVKIIKNVASFQKLKRYHRDHKNILNIKYNSKYETKNIICSELKDELEKQKDQLKTERQRDQKIIECQNQYYPRQSKQFLSRKSKDKLFKLLAVNSTFKIK